MDQTTLDRLTTLSESYKQQKFRLPRPQIDEAASLLVQGLTGDVEGVPGLVDKFVCLLPPDSIAKAIRDSWVKLADETKGHLQRGILRLPRTDRFDRLKLVAAAAVVDMDSQRGPAFLCGACSSLDSKASGHMSAEVLQIFRKTFLDEIECRLEQLDITAHSSAVTGALLGSIVQSLFYNSTESPSAPVVFQFRIVKWIFRNRAYPRLKAAQQTQLIDAIKRWDPALQLEFRATFESLPPGFEFLLVPTPQKDIEPRSESPESIKSKSEVVLA